MSPSPTPIEEWSALADDFRTFRLELKVDGAVSESVAVTVRRGQEEAWTALAAYSWRKGGRSRL